MDPNLPSPESYKEALDRIEREQKGLTHRLKQVEGIKPSPWSIVIGNVLLVLLAALLADYMGLMPSFVERLPLRASSVDTEAYWVRDSEGKLWGKLFVLEGDLVVRRVGDSGRLEGDPIKLSSDFKEKRK